MSASTYISLAIAIVVIILVIYFAVKKEWETTHAPMMLSFPYCGSIASSYYASSPRCLVVDSKSRPDGIVVSNMPRIDESRARFSLMFFVKPDNSAKMTRGSYTSASAKNFTDLNLDQKNNAKLFVLGENDFSLSYDSFKNELVVSVRILYSFNRLIPDREHQEFRLTDAVRPQRWNMVLIILDGRTLDVYLDDTLYRSWTLLNVPILAGKDWRVFPGFVPFEGAISCMRFFDYAIKKKDVAGLYSYYASPKNTKKAPVAGSMWWMWIPKSSYTW